MVDYYYVRRMAEKAKKENYKCDGLCSSCLYVKIKNSPKECNPDEYKKVVDSLIEKE